MADRLKTKFWRDGSTEIALLDCTGHRFPKHFHNEYVIGVNLVGGESIWLDGKQEEVSQQGITVYNPGEIQSSAPLADKWAFVSIYFDEDYYTSKFGRDIAARFDKPVVQSEPLARSLGIGCQLCLSGECTDEEVHEFILLACDGLFNHTAGSEGRGRGSDSITNTVMDMMLGDVSVVPRLEDLAWSVSMSPVQLARMFKNNIGLPPMAWFMNKKLHMVRDELANGEKAQYLALKYGFSDHPHLTRRFKAMFGYTPSAYRNALK